MATANNPFVSSFEFAAYIYDIELAPNDLDATRPYGLTYAIVSDKGFFVRKGGSVQLFRGLERATKNCERWNSERPGYRVVIVRELEGAKRERGELGAKAAVAAWERDRGERVDELGAWCENAILAAQEVNEMSL